jgi:epoxyqueuosine reductase
VVDKLTQSIISNLLQWGADLVGIAPIDRFRNAPAGHHPSEFMPACKSTISVSMHIHQGVADVWGNYDQPNKTNTPYLFYGYGLTNLEMAGMANRIAKTLEYRGYKSLCFLPTWITSMAKYMDETKTTRKLKAEISHRHAAVAAGLGVLGLNGLVLTPEFGSMQRLVTVLTSAELEPTPLYHGPELCRPELCGMKCVRLCPAKAFSEEERQSCAIGDRTFTYSTHDNIRCSYAIHGMIKGDGARSEIAIPEGPGDISRLAQELRGKNIHPFDRAMLNNCFGIICGDFCGKCLHQCPAKELSRKDLEDYDFSARHSVLNPLHFPSSPKTGNL